MALLGCANFDGYSTLNQQTGSVEHLPLVTVGSARVRPSVISGDAEDGETAIMYLQSRVQRKQINVQTSKRPNVQTRDGHAT